MFIFRECYLGSSLPGFSSRRRPCVLFRAALDLLLNPLIGCDFLALLIGFVRVQSRAVFDWPRPRLEYQIKLTERPVRIKNRILNFESERNCFFFHLFTPFNSQRFIRCFLDFTPRGFDFCSGSLTRLHTVLIIAKGRNPEVTRVFNFRRFPFVSLINCADVPTHMHARRQISEPSYRSVSWGATPPVWNVLRRAVSPDWSVCANHVFVCVYR